MMSIYGKATKKVNIRIENAIERSSGKKNLENSHIYLI